jgi:hypothetical protein
MSDEIRLRRDTAANWATLNPVLGPGEPGYDRTTQTFRVGDGVTAWNLLPVEGGRTDAAWHVIGDPGEPAFLNGWTNYGSNYSAAAFRLVAGVVRLRGVVKSGTVGQPAFILPVGYRTSTARLFATISNALIGRVDVLPDPGTNAGGVVPASPSSNAWLSMDGLSFIPE